MKELRRCSEEVGKVLKEVGSSSPPLRVEEFRAELRAHVPKFLDIVETTKDFKGCFEELEEADFAELRSRRRSARALRDRMVAKLEGGQSDNTPHTVAKIFADVLHNLAAEKSPAAEPELQCDPSDPEAVATALSSVQLLSASDDAPTWLHSGLKEFFAAGEGSFRQKINDKASLDAPRCLATQDWKLNFVNLDECIIPSVF